MELFREYSGENLINIINYQLANIKTLSVVMIIAYHGKPALTEPKLIFHL